MSAAAVRAMRPLGSRLLGSKLPVHATAPRRVNTMPTLPRAGARAFSQSSIWQVKKYTEQHEWIELESDGSTATIGITKYAANALGDVVFVELPEVGLEIAAGETMGAVESVKSASDIMSPVSGEIIEANAALEEKPKVINDSPEGEGWIARIKVADAKELGTLMDEEAYTASLEEAE